MIKVKEAQEKNLLELLRTKISQIRQKKQDPWGEIAIFQKLLQCKRHYYEDEMMNYRLREYLQTFYLMLVLYLDYANNSYTQQLEDKQPNFKIGKRGVPVVVQQKQI